VGFSLERAEAPPVAPPTEERPTRDDLAGLSDDDPDD
jgi:hypothetical protein